MVRVPTHAPPAHPGEFLREDFLAPLEMTQAALAEAIDVSTQRVNELIRGKRGITPDTALRLEKLFGVNAGFWMNAQAAWDLYHARKESAPAVRRIKTLENKNRVVA